jgi:hypothetical protein
MIGRMPFPKKTGASFEENLHSRTSLAEMLHQLRLTLRLVKPNRAIHSDRASLKETFDVVAFERLAGSLTPQLHPKAWRSHHAIVA